MTINAAKIRKLRESAGLSQTEAASRAGMERTQWVRLEAGTGREDSIRLLERVAAVLGVGIGELVSVDPAGLKPTRAGMKARVTFRGKP